jgi:acyl-CoA thioester hydrolase
MKDQTLKKELVSRKHIVVRFSEVDPMGVVWHGNYAKYLEDGREAFGIEFGIGYLDFDRNGLFAPIVRLECDYRRPLRYGDGAVVETRYEFTESSKLVFNYSILSETSGEIVARGRSVQVFTDNAGKLFLAYPPFYEQWLRSHGYIK